MSTRRGTFNFDVSNDGDPQNTPANLTALQRLWLDREMIHGGDLGPGNQGDFDHGAWHVACHLAGASGVRRSAGGRLLWLEISHNPGADDYYASLTVRNDSTPKTFPLAAPEAQALLDGSTLLGFVEGNSLGHISARGAQDTPARFNKWQRQDFDQPAESSAAGGKVWEHWCTVRDIRSTQAIAMSVLRAYLELVAILGDKFVPTVARGRREFGHPRQLCAMVRAGLTSKAAATWDTKPFPIPAAVESLLLEATPAQELTAAEQLQWDGQPRYYMFGRKIARWSPAHAVQEDLARFPTAT